MDAIGFLYVSLGSSTVQLHDSLGSRRAWEFSEPSFSSQNDDSTLGLYQRRAAFCCEFFCGKKVSRQRIIIKKYVLFTVGNVCRVKRFTTGLQMFRWWRGWNGDAEVAETTVKRLLCCGFRRTGKAMGKECECWWRIFLEIHAFPVSNITCFTYYIHLWSIYWLSLVCTTRSITFLFEKAITRRVRLQRLIGSRIFVLRMKERDSNTPYSTTVIKLISSTATNFKSVPLKHTKRK
jgi:hypothetical protein